MRKFAPAGLVTLVMLSFGALAQAEGPIFHIIDGTCGLFDATGYIWEVTGLHVTSSTDPKDNTHLHCNATLPLDAGATAASGKPVVWDANSCDDLPVAAPPGAFAVTCDPDGLIYCMIAGAGRTSDWHDIVNSSGRSNASCTFHPK